MKISLLSIGKLKGPYADLCADYTKRLTHTFKLKEMTAASQKAEGQALIAALPPKAFLVVLDEHGQDLSSRAFAEKLQNWQEQSTTELVFAIGGADGHTKEVKERANFTLGLGQKTWPHKLARVMFLEQLYRAQQINAGHPYHRD